MPVDTKNAVYIEKEEDWKMLGTVCEGERSIKDAGSTYLPMLGGQTDAEYKSYKARGSFFNATQRTLSGFHGAIMRKAPSIDIGSNALDSVLNDFTIDGKSVEMFIASVAEYVLKYGFLGAFADSTSELSPRPYGSLYDPFSIVGADFAVIDGMKKLVGLRLREKFYTDNPDDPYVQVENDRIYEYLLEDGGLVVYKYEYDKENDTWNQMDFTTSSGVDTPELRPTKLGGQRVTEIPFVFFGCVDNDSTPPKPPLLDLANLNIKHWQLSVDYYHGLHYCALPTPWLAGFPENTKVHIGPQKALVSDKPDAKCGYLEFTGEGLKAVKDAITDLEKNMAVMGARLLEEQKAGVETADAIRLRSTGDTATLSTIVTAIEEGMKQLLKFLAMWLNQDIDPTVTLNRDFVSEKIDPQLLVALLAALQAGKISQDTFLYNLKMGEILPPDVEIDDEKVKIDSESISLMESTMSTADDTVLDNPLPEEYE